MFLHKPVKSLFLPFAAGLALLTSCVTDSYPDEELIPGNGEPSVSLTSYHVDFLITMGTTEATGRAGTMYDDANQAGDGDFVKGDANEHNIGSAFALLFKDDRFHSYSLLTLTPVNSDGQGHQNIEYYARANFNANPDDCPDRCIILINASFLLDEIQGWNTTMTLTNAINMIWKEADEPRLLGFDKGAYEGYFTMANSTYIKDGRIEPAVAIGPTNIMEGDKDFDESKVVHVPVERMVAKVSFRIVEEDVVIREDGSVEFPVGDAIYCTRIDDNSGAPVLVQCKWRPIVTSWNMNGLERESKFIKEIDMSVPFAGWSDWNDPSNFRSYWAVDQNYSSGYYPEQYRKAVDVTLNDFSKQPSTLKYYSYNELDYRTPDNKVFINKSVYVPENTYDASKLNLGERVHKLAGTHLIICADLELDYGEGFKKQEYFRDIHGVFYGIDKECFWTLVGRFNNTLLSQTSMKYKLFEWDNPETELTPKTTYEALTTGQRFQLCYNGEPITYEMVMRSDFPKIMFIPATIKGGDGKLIPWIPGMTIEDASGKKLRIYTKIVQNLNPEDPNYGDLVYENEVLEKNYVRETTDNDVKSLLLEWVGAVDRYDMGRMYYAAPAKISDGIHGVVRNGWYQYNLSGIKNVGTSVDDPDQPIIPDEVKTNDQLNLTIDIIGWHKFEFTAPLL